MAEPEIIEPTADATDVEVAPIGLVWFRRDLRLRDNPAWAAATAAHQAVIPLYVIDPRLMATAGPYRRRYLVASLQALDYDLFEATGGRLLVRIGDPTRLVPEAVDVLQAGALYMNADTTPFARRRDAAVTAAITVPVHESWGTLVHRPGAILTPEGTVPRQFVPFARKWEVTQPDPWPEAGEAMVYDDPGEPIPRLDGQSPLPEGEGEAERRLQAFAGSVDVYDVDRVRSDLAGTSRLSADLRFGVLSPRRVAEVIGDGSPGRELFVRQLARRDWYAHLVGEMPQIVTRNMNPEFDALRWRNEAAEISAWKGGFTGYPIVDAGMRQLRETGWLHDGVRSIVGSFLVKDLLVDWRIGEAHFRFLLVDADIAQNVGNWQWLGGTGHDAAPFDQILDPVDLGRQVDPSGDYISRWVPELAALTADQIHAPWELETHLLLAAGVALGSDYPERIVDHSVAADRAAAVFESSCSGDVDDVVEGAT